MEKTDKTKKKKNTIIIICSIILLIITGFFVVYFSGVINSYTITFTNYDGTILEEQLVKKNELPVFHGEAIKPSDDFYDYEFVSWDKPIVIATKDTTYTAIFSAVLKQDVEKKAEEIKEREIIDDPTLEPEIIDDPSNNYYVISFIDDNGKVLQSSRVKAGATPNYRGEMPSKTISGREFYFSGWSPNVGPAIGEQKYYATYSATLATEDTTKTEAQKRKEMLDNEYDYDIYDYENESKTTVTKSTDYDYSSYYSSIQKNKDDNQSIRDAREKDLEDSKNKADSKNLDDATSTGSGKNSGGTSSKKEEENTIKYFSSDFNPLDHFYDQEFFDYYEEYTYSDDY